MTAEQTATERPRREFVSHSNECRFGGLCDDFCWPVVHRADYDALAAKLAEAEKASEYWEWWTDHRQEQIEERDATIAALRSENAALRAVVDAAKAWNSDLIDEHDADDADDFRGGPRECNRCFVDRQLCDALAAIEGKKP